jgi:predicted nucleic acid-binding protein
VATYFLDSSAVVKRYVSEPGSGWLRTIVAPTAGNELYVARIAAVEVVSALVRHDPPVPILAQTMADFKLDLEYEYLRLELTDVVLDRAVALVEKHRLRGYDGVQLAAACELRDARAALSLPPMTIVSADANLYAAATAEGRLVENPNLHP